MDSLTRDDLFSLEKYALIRDVFRARVIAHKKNRRIILGDHLVLHFENRLTIQYQIQEILRVERIFEPKKIEAELNIYNPLIPNGHNWKVTLMLEYMNVAERRVASTKLYGIEEKVWVKIGNHRKVFPIANEDIARSTTGRTASVHFLRFELDTDMIAGLKAGARLSMGVAHPSYTYTASQVTAKTRRSLIQDLA